MMVERSVTRSRSDCRSFTRAGLTPLLGREKQPLAAGAVARAEGYPKQVLMHADRDSLEFDQVANAA